MNLLIELNEFIWKKLHTQHYCIIQSSPRWTFIIHIRTIFNEQFSDPFIAYGNNNLKCFYFSNRFVRIWWMSRHKCLRNSIIMKWIPFEAAISSAVSLFGPFLAFKSAPFSINIWAADTRPWNNLYPITSNEWIFLSISDFLHHELES